MRGVPLTSLAEVAESVSYGYTASASEREVGPKFLRITDIVPPQIDWARVPYCKIDERNLVKFSLQPGDIVIARTGATVGYAKLIREAQPCVFASYLVRVRVDAGKADPEYVGRVVESEVFKRFVLSRAGGAAQPNANAKVLASFRFPLPGRSSQVRIAAILSAYDSLIANNRRRIQLLEQAAQLLYKEWFVHLRFPGHEHVNVINGIPEAWSIQKLPDLCTQVIDGTHDSPKPTERGFPLVTGRHLVDGFIDFSSCYRISPEDHAKVMKRSNPEKGDIIFSNIGTLGSIVLVDHDFEFSIKNVALFKPLNRLFSTYLYIYFSYPRSLQEILSRASGTSQKFLSLKFLRSWEVVLPDETILDLFGQALSPLLQQRSTLKNQLDSLAQARDLLLPRLMNGEIAV